MNAYGRKSAEAYAFFFCLLLFCSTASCGHGRAVIDHSASEKILWPGPPEKPRISFLWSVSIIAESKEAGWASLFAGEEDPSDPRSSNRLLRPYSIFVDGQGVLYITDPGAYRITMIDPRTGESRHIRGAGREEFLYPLGIAVSRNRIYASDSLLGKVFILDRDGRKMGEFQGEFRRPTALAIDRKEEIIYVTDTLAHKIYRYDTHGNRLGAIGQYGEGEGEFNYPTHIWIDRKGKLLINDAMNFRIQIFSPDGRFEKMFGTLGDAHGEFDKPKGVATDSDGNIYVVDSIRDVVKIFDRDGMLLLFWGEKGTDLGQFYLPSGIFIDVNNTVYIADTYNGRVQVFRYLGGD